MYLKNDHDQLVQSFLETFIHHKYSSSIKFSLPETELRSLLRLSDRSSANLPYLYTP